MKELSRVGMLAAVNLLLAGTASAMEKITFAFHVLLTLGQIGVAAVTILYIWKKIKALKKSK